MKVKATPIVLILFLSCSFGEPPVEQQLEGAWKMMSYTYYQQDKAVEPKVYVLKDSIDQVKMFHEGHFMWIRRNYQNNPEKFGFGAYEVKGNELFETVALNANSIDKYQLEAGGSYHFLIEVALDTMRQFALDVGGNKVYSEDYLRIK